MNAIVIGVVGLFVIGFGSLVSRTGDQLDGGVQIDGRVVATHESDGDGHRCTKVVRYIVDGAEYRVRSSRGSSSYCDDIGEIARVSYLPEDPHRAIVADPQAR